MSSRLWPEIYALLDAEMQLVKVGWAFIAGERVSRLASHYADPDALELIWVLQYRAYPDLPPSFSSPNRSHATAIAQAAERFFHFGLTGVTNPRCLTSDGATEWFLFEPRDLRFLKSRFLKSQRPRWIETSFL